MDEEKNYTAPSDRGPVRPSMVIMTSKLLNVTEGMAAMNLRIAFGVLFCIVLLVATFIINIIAFDYAKDNKTAKDTMFVVDKSSGEPLNYHPKWSGYSPELTFASLSEMKELGAPLIDGTSMGSYQISAVERLPCPEAGSDRCVGDYLFAMHTNIGKVFFATDHHGQTHFLQNTDPAFLQKANDAVVSATAHSRHLLFHRCTMDGSGCFRGH